MNRSTLILLPLLLAATALLAPSEPLRAQTLPSPSNIIEEDYDSSFEEKNHGDDEGLEESWYLDELEEYRRHPLDLRSTTADALARLPGISLHDAEAILAFIDTSSPTTIDQLDSIPELTAEGLLSLRSFTRLRKEKIAHQQMEPAARLRLRFASDLQPRRGYSDQHHRVIPRHDPVTADSTGLDTIALGSSYLGDRTALQARIMAGWEMISAGITIEKDQGEPFILSDTLDYAYRRYEYITHTPRSHTIRRRIIPFIGAHAAVRLAPMTIYLGDYTAELGQGLLFGAPFSGRKGSDVIKAPYRSARGLASHASAGEGHFLRGAGITLNEGEWLPDGISATLFASHRWLDGSIANGEEENEGEIVTIRDDGLHRTRSEIRSSGNLLERLAGAHLEARFRSGTIGITGYGARYSEAAGDDRSDRRESGPTMMIGLNGTYRLWWGWLFGEAARSGNGAIGGVGGITTKLGAVELILAGRWLPASFRTPHGAGFGETPLRPRNEWGLYLGARMRLAPGAHCSAYLDLYDAPDRTPALSFPRAGSDAYLGLDYAPARGIELHGRLRCKRGLDEVTLVDELGRERRGVLDRLSINGRIEASYTTSGERVRLAARFERRVVTYDAIAPSGSGILSFIDLRLRPVRTLLLGMRLALFKSDGFDAGLYQFEQDLPSRMTNRSLSGEGRRFYLYLRWRHSQSISIAAKYAETHFADRRTISPRSLQQIDGRLDNSLAVQLDVTLGPGGSL